MSTYRNGFEFLNSVKAKFVCTLIIEPNIGNDFSSVILQPNGYCSASVCIPHLHTKRHISIQAEVRRNYTLKPFEFRKILFWIMP